MASYRLSDTQRQETLNLKLRLHRHFLHVRMPGIYIHVYHDVWQLYHIFHSEGISVMFCMHQLQSPADPLTLPCILIFLRSHRMSMTAAHLSVPWNGSCVLQKIPR